MRGVWKKSLVIENFVIQFMDPRMKGVSQNVFFHCSASLTVPSCMNNKYSDGM